MMNLSAQDIRNVKRNEFDRDLAHLEARFEQALAGLDPLNEGHLDSFMNTFASQVEAMLAGFVNNINDTVRGRVPRGPVPVGPRLEPLAGAAAGTAAGAALGSGALGVVVQAATAGGLFVKGKAAVTLGGLLWTMGIPWMAPVAVLALVGCLIGYNCAEAATRETAQRNAREAIRRHYRETVRPAIIGIRDEMLEKVTD